MPFISRITPDRTLLALANKLCKMYRCFPGHRTLLISHQSSTSRTSLDAVCMPCHSRVQKTNCGKWLRGNGEPSLRTPSKGRSVKTGILPATNLKYHQKTSHRKEDLRGQEYCQPPSYNTIKRLAIESRL
ncbi:hypothetical protein LAZ67_22001399 [Cordylochernes scorpioides]|uniref:Uncharacterized protein n=1 Tax=Cordylochernes scorpioides TaxID=51811 RepID=A0ABY6LS04_9ARAC|nr:hypothetical protein LAZ67_22001399 [Cordylochernes scorpioides]